ncbi:HIPL1 protein isoform X1 [Brachypodium distachyon]|nr:HIPL1 protein isoform X1 [Brachypodium distachyon]|eukprot:XP_014757348.1 HIPL1 protein isoform X1 [Brachypodium distachyon]
MSGLERMAALQLAPLLVLLLLCSSSVPLHEASPLCTDMREPVVLNVTLKFCGNDAGRGCCDAAADDALQAQFEAMDVEPADGQCARLVKSMLCSKCNLFSADLFDIGYINRTVPLLCSSFSARGSSQTEHPTHNNMDYCGQVWKHCKSTAMLNSPFQSFAPRKVGLTGSSSMLTDFWQSEEDFCVSLSGTPNNRLVCFNGHGVSFNNRRNASPSPTGMCLEKIGNGSYLNMVGHPDGSSKAFFSRQDGKIWLATVPEQGTTDSLQLDETIPFLDLATKGHLSSDLGLVAVAFHPEFVINGRFFVSYICDGTLSSNCSGRCSCDLEVGCDPSKIGSDNGVEPCRYQLVISEYSAKGSSSSFSEATFADPSEVRRVFSMGLPYVSNHAGQLLFGPNDGCLYFFTGNGGIRGDPFNFSQNGKSLLGKVLRLDVDELPEMNEVANQSLWGNYTIPKDNPHTGDSNLQPEIWAWGLENPWRCSFDSVRPFHLYCADDGQEQYKVVDLISKGGNYGWSAAHEDQDIHYPPWASQGTKPTNGIFFPIMGYTVPSTTKYAAIVGGYVYRGSADSCLYGRYLFSDMYSCAMWTGTVNTDGSGKYISDSIQLSCSEKTPLPCDWSTNSPLDRIFSFGEDNKQDGFILASQGVYRIVQASLCDYVCVNDATAKQVTASISGGRQGMPTFLKVLIAVLSVLGASGAIYFVRKCFCNNSAICCNDIETMLVVQR